MRFRGSFSQRVIDRLVAPRRPLDEPGAFLDIRHTVEIYDLLQDLQREGRSIVTVLHDLITTDADAGALRQMPF